MTRLSDDDVISRCIIYGKAFKGGFHVNDNLFRFDQSPRESVVARSVMPRSEDVHEKGCSIAELQNSRTNPPSGDPKKRYYCGFRSARIGDIETKGYSYELVIELREENGDKSHVHIELLVDEPNKSERNRIKTEAGLDLADSFGPAEEYICKCDCNDDHHPLKINPRCLIDGLNSFA